MTKVFTSDNPTKLCHDSFFYLMEHGEELAPRGKRIKEIRPAVLELENPYNKMTFLGGRQINPFFQLAEFWWMANGRADTEWLCKFNKSMAAFSDDGKTFNAPYGERIMKWGDNAARGISLEKPLNQLYDACMRIKEDKDTRQATIAIGNPSFDNYEYLYGHSYDEKDEGIRGKDIACLVAGTMIDTVDGKKPVEEIVPGDIVLSYSEETKKIEPKEVLVSAKTGSNVQTVKVSFGDNSIVCTPNHPIYTDGGVKESRYISPIDKVFLKDGDEVVNEKISGITSNGVHDVYNITVADNHNYFANGILVHNCNIYMTFKVRDDKLNLSVFNRSNDAIFGYNGANIAQFTSFMELLCSWLNEYYPELTLGTYNQITDSYHTYLDDYGSSINDDIINYYRDHEFVDIVPVKDELRMSCTYDEFNDLCDLYWKEIDPIIMAETKDIEAFDKALEQVKDRYFYFTFQALMVYQLFKNGQNEEAVKYLHKMQNCQTKLALVEFLSTRKAVHVSEEEMKSFVEELSTQETRDFIEDRLMWRVK